MGIYSVNAVYDGCTPTDNNSNSAICQHEMCFSGGEYNLPTYYQFGYWYYTGNPPAPNTMTLTAQFALVEGTWTNDASVSCPIQG